ncbi:MAG TPA: hypothetical protein IAB04_02965, partial [Candidatus Avimonoglobus intestinipullorum]|nr:hypothetical protein [Candidatus Avimonoglobus intestinipullorum]
KHGTAVYGVFYNQESDDIQIKAINMMSIYCDMHLENVQDSQFLFITNAVDNQLLREQYPEFKNLFVGDATVESYSDTSTVYDRTEVIDCYYKKPGKGVQLIKFVKDTVIDATEDTPGYEEGLYRHGMYPVVFDCLYPEEDCPFGYGIVDVIRNPQRYIDKLDAIILKNSMMAGQQRWFAKENGAVNMDQFQDFSNPIITVQGSLDETHLKPFQAQALPNQILTHRNEKIAELKEVIGNRDFQQGGTANGVTAASAITMLQQAGEKLSRAMIDDSYDAYKKIVVLCIELMREFYKEERIYRITNDQGEKAFAALSNDMLLKAEEERDAFGFPIGTIYRNAEFDVEVLPQRQNPFTREMNNQTVMTLYQAGFFNPQNLEMSLVALEAMQFDGKEKIMQRMQEINAQNQLVQEQMAQAQAAASGGGAGQFAPTELYAEPGLAGLMDPAGVSAPGTEEFVPIDIGQGTI